MVKKIVPAFAAALLLLAGICAGCAPLVAGSNPDDSPSGQTQPANSPGGAFVFTRENFPRLDGSESTSTLGQAVASVLLGEPRDSVADLIAFSGAVQAYRNLMSGLADILIAAQAPPAVLCEMEDAGFECQTARIASDAIVFVVGPGNPVDSLTSEQLRKIYTGKVKNWSEVGGSNGEIAPLHMGGDSEDRALMEKLVMDGRYCLHPSEERAYDSLDDLAERISRPGEASRAIGYMTYCRACQLMKKFEGLKILAVDGVEPGDDTLSDGTYPFTYPICAVIPAAEPEGSPARVLFGWLKSTEGQNLVRIEGYVPVSR